MDTDRDDSRWPEHWRPINHDPEAVRSAREARGWSQRRLAQELGKSRSLVCEIEAGTRNANPDLLRQIARLLGVAPMRLEHTPAK